MSDCDYPARPSDSISPLVQPCGYDYLRLQYVSYRYEDVMGIQEDEEKGKTSDDEDPSNGSQSGRRDVPFGTSKVCVGESSPRPDRKWVSIRLQNVFHRLLFSTSSCSVFWYLYCLTYASSSTRSICMLLICRSLL